MRVGSKNDFLSWLTALGLPLPREGVRAPADWKLVSVELPEYYGRNTLLIDAIFGLLSDPPFAGAAMCTGEFAMISDESATSMIFDRLRSCATGQSSCAEETYFTEFDRADYDDLYSLSLIAALGRWDFWIVASDRSYIARFSHDGFCIVGTKSVAMIDRLIVWLNDLEFGFSHVHGF